MQSCFQRVGKNVTEKVSKWVDTGCSDTNIDGERLFKDIATAVQQLNSEGYEVICMTEVTSDRYNWGTTGGQFNAGYGYGYSITEGVTIVARKVS